MNNFEQRFNNEQKKFFKNTTAIGGALTLGGFSTMAKIITLDTDPWFGRSMCWTQLAFVENDPGRCDPDFWLNYFKRIHANGALLSDGGVVAFYPTEISLHHKNEYLTVSVQNILEYEIVEIDLA